MTELPNDIIKIILSYISYKCDMCKKEFINYKYKQSDYMFCSRECKWSFSL